MDDPIDIIDLTKDSPANKNLRLHRARSANAPTKPHWNRVASDDNLNRKRYENISEPTVIIDLDETVPTIENDKCCCSTSRDKANVLQCPICFEEITSAMKPVSTRCGHIFCTQCLNKAFEKVKKCPSCQSKITQKSCIRLYF